MTKPLLLIAVAFCALSFTIGYSFGMRDARSNAKEYQFDVDSSGYYIYDNGAAVGHLKYGDNQTLDSLIDYDNK